VLAAPVICSPADVVRGLLWSSGVRTDYRVSLGKQGEELACAALERRGYAIVARRYRTRCGEIDVVARDGGTMVFVEVKAKAGKSWGTARDAVTLRKRRQVISMAKDYLARHPVNAESCRFDVVAVTISRRHSPLVEVIQDAFTVNDC
jgi:putative endonuclease